MRGFFLGALLVAGMVLMGCGAGTEPIADVQVAVSHSAAETLKATQVQRFYEATGTVDSRSKATVSARIVGNVAVVRVQEGDAVRTGQILLEIDDRDLGSQARQADAMVREAEAALNEVDQAIRAGESAKASAAASLELASSTLARFTTLRERNAVSPHEFDEVVSREAAAQAEVARAEAMLEAQRARRTQILARIDQANARVESSRIALAYARISAPFDGLITKKLVSPGTQAAPGVPLLEMESRDYEIDVALPETEMSGVRPGAVVDVSIPAAPLEHAAGTVASIVPEVDPSTRSYTAKVRLSSSAAANLRSGMYAQVRIPTGARDVLAVPRTAIVTRGQLEGVFVVDAESVIRFRLVRTGEALGENVEVLSGLSAGDRVFFSLDESIKDGALWQQ